ncbi:MAG TPA: DUF2911 domain-containing protein [Opitutus sp.]|nr:DUF2911 domain-containing protein [Opitutus sp.]
MLLSFAFAAGLQAQATNKIEFPAPSPTASLKQRVGLTDISIDYSRPGVKGRQIFGGLIPYGEVWRTGANAASKISFSTPVKLNGTEIPAGTYELFSIPAKDKWTVILAKDSSDWGAYSYDPKNDVARIAAQPRTAPELVETFTIGLGDLRDESATLYLAWENTYVPLKLEVDVAAKLVPQIKAAMASDSAEKPYFQAALFYFEHQIDLNQAAEWMDAASQAQPQAFWVFYHKARLLAALGRKADAIAAAQRSIEIAKKAGGAVQEEYIRLNENLIARLR